MICEFTRVSFSVSCATEKSDPGPWFFSGLDSTYIHLYTIMASIPSGKTRKWNKSLKFNCTGVCLPTTGNDKPDPRDTNRNIVPNFAVKWRELGEALRIPSSQLDIINTDLRNSCEERCRAVLRKWIELDPSATWGKLIDVVNIIQPVLGASSTATEGNCIMYSVLLTFSSNTHGPVLGVTYVTCYVITFVVTK